MRARIKDQQTGKVRVKFQCAKCGFQDVQEFTEATVIACSSCGKPVEQDQSPWDKREWLCDACHAVIESGLP
jgi:transposase